MKKELTAERLRELLEYDPLTGIFTWKIRAARRIRIGDVAGTKDNKGYVQFKVGGRMYRAHRVAWIYVTGKWPVGEIDHIDGTRNNNIFSNLRDVPKAVNMQNIRRIGRANTSGLLGVSSHRGKWQSSISVDGKKRYLGSFDSPGEANAAYLAEKRTSHIGNTL